MFSSARGRPHDHFWLITNWTSAQRDGAGLLEMYRERGTAEGYMGELMDVFRPALSSASRPKSHYRGKVLDDQSSTVNAFAHNEVILLLNALAYNIAHAGRALMEMATGEGWSLRRFRERVLRVASRVLVHSRRATLILAKGSTKLWHALWLRLAAVHVAPGLVARRLQPHDHRRLSFPPPRGVAEVRRARRPRLAQAPHDPSNLRRRPRVARP